MTNDVVLAGDPQSTKSSVPVVAIQGNSMIRQLIRDDAVVVIVVVQAKRRRLPRKAQILDHLGSIGLDLEATKVTLITNGPALMGTIIAVESLVAEDHALSGRHDLDESPTVLC